MFDKSNHWKVFQSSCSLHWAVEETTGCAHLEVNSLLSILIRLPYLTLIWSLIHPFRSSPHSLGSKIIMKVGSPDGRSRGTNSPRIWGLKFDAKLPNFENEAKVLSLAGNSEDDSHQPSESSCGAFCSCLVQIRKACLHRLYPLNCTTGYIPWIVPPYFC